MRSLPICLCVLAALVSLAACGKSQPQQATATPSLTVNMDLTVQLKGHRVTTIHLLPSGHPSGVVALKAVHDGHLVTIGSQRFSGISDTGYLTVEVSARGIEMGWNIPQGTRALQGNCAAAFPAGSSWAGADYGDETVDPGPSETGGTVWNLTYDTARTTADGAGVSDAGAAAVKESTKFPTETAYCVTVILNR